MGQVISNYEQIKRKPGYDGVSTADFREGPPAQSGLWWDRNQLFRGPAGLGNERLGVNFKLGREPITLAQTAAAGPWEPRDGARILYLGDVGYMLGGWQSAPVATWGNKNTTNQVWKTLDYGVTWELILPHSNTPINQFRRKHTFGAIVKEGYMYVAGSDHEDDIYGNSQCMRSNNGIYWEEMCASGTPGWHGQILTGFGCIGGVFHAVAGQTDLAGSARKTHWQSADNCVTWTQLADAPFSPRSTTINLPEWRGELWYLCGGIYNEASRTYYNGAYAFNGSSWRTVLADGNNQLPPVHYGQAFAFDDRLWMTRGYNEHLGGNQYRLYWTETGTIWHQYRGSSQLPPSHADGAGIGPNGVLFTSGNYTLSGYPKTSHLMTRI